MLSLTIITFSAYGFQVEQLTNADEHLLGTENSEENYKAKMYEL